MTDSRHMFDITICNGSVDVQVVEAFNYWVDNVGNLIVVLPNDDKRYFNARHWTTFRASQTCTKS